MLGCPISRSLTACCVCLELRPLPSTGITRFQRYYEPLRHPSAPGLSLTGVRLIIPDHASGFPVLRALSLCTCCRHYPGAADGRTRRSKIIPSVSAFPDSTIGSACTSTFSRFARRLLALRPAHSRGHQIRDRYPGASDISSPPCLPRLLPAGAIAGWALHPLEKRRLVTAHVGSGHSFFQTKLESLSYTHVRDIVSTPQGITAKAMKGEKPMTIAIDATGKAPRARLGRSAGPGRLRQPNWGRARSYSVARRL